MSEPRIRGLEGVVVGSTRLSRVDGDAGRLLIGGYPVEDLAPEASFEEVVFLLWNDRLPDPEEGVRLRQGMAADRPLPDTTLGLLREAAARGVSTLDALPAALASLALARPELTGTELGREQPETRQARARALVAVLPTLVAAHARLAAGAEPVEPDPELSHCANFLFMLDGERPSPARARALETYLVTTVDHGMNASTFAARVVASTRSDLLSAALAALGALKGPLHGGAPGPALDMVLALRERSRRSGRALVDEAEAFVRRSVSRGGRVMGFGHRVYRVRDPRADVLARALERLFPDRTANPLYDDARQVEQVVLRVLREEKPGRRLDTNVEFYTALLLHGLGLPASLFTPTFAIARIGGWTAHALEQTAEDRLIRPRVAYAGSRRVWTSRVA